MSDKDELPIMESACSQEEIKQLYIASQEAERRYRAFLKFLPLPLLVQNMDHSVAYINPAFEATFGWTRQDLEQNPLAHIPKELIRQTRMGKLALQEDRAVSGVETKRVTKDGRTLDVIHDGSVFYDHNDNPAGIVVALRDVTQAQKDAKTTRSLFQIAKALHHYADLDGLLAFISRQVIGLMRVRHAHIILVDHERNEYYFRAGSVHGSETYQKFSEIRIPLDNNNLGGRVILSGKPKIVNDVAEENLRIVIFPDRDVRTIMGVPMRLGKQIIGAMVVNNKAEGKFNQDDVTLLGSIADLVSLPLENARIHDALRKSYEEIKTLNRAKDRIIDHLSHELRTPLAVLAASLDMLVGDRCPEPETAARILARSQRNLNRIVEMQSKIADITRNPYRRTRRTLSALLALCSDGLESLMDIEIGPDAAERIRKRIDEYFGIPSSEMLRLDLAAFADAELERIRPQFAHRRIGFHSGIEDGAGHVSMPPDVLSKIITGLVRNAVEYTPDGGNVTVTVRRADKGPELIVSDTGVGITRENQALIFGDYFTTANMSTYRTESPYSFNAGGSGFDLLRMRVFSERYHFKILMHSGRCPHIPTDEDVCPGSTEACSHCDTEAHCRRSGATRFTIQFPPGDETEGKQDME